MCPWVLFHILFRYDLLQDSDCCPLRYSRAFFVVSLLCVCQSQTWNLFPCPHHPHFPFGHCEFVSWSVSLSVS